MGVFDGILGAALDPVKARVAAKRQKWDSGSPLIPIQKQQDGNYKIKRDVSGSLNFIDWSALSEEQKAQLRRAGVAIP
jgi:hypothetical protein